MEPTEERINRVTDQVKTNTQLFLDELWKQSDKGQKVVDIDIGGRITWPYLLYLESIGCIAYDYYYPGGHYQVTVKRKEAGQ